jgi:TRAP-type C4-dicarboxylate transport system substrate-binding protein
MNKDVWDSISAADQEAITALSGEAFATKAGQQFDTAFTNALDSLAADGLEISAPSPALLASLQERLASFEADYVTAATAKGIDAEAALAFYRNQFSN